MRNRPTSEPVDVLLVEDNPGDARLVEEAFEASEWGATLHTASSGDDALSFLSDRRRAESYPDLLLLDLNLPRMDGFAVLEELREDPEHQRLPVLVLTSSGATEDVERSYELAANAYLTKPRSHDGFVSLVRAVEEFWFEAAHLPTVSR